MQMWVGKHFSNIKKQPKLAKLFSWIQNFFSSPFIKRIKKKKKKKQYIQLVMENLKGPYNAILSFPFSLECYKLIVYR